MSNHLTVDVLGVHVHQVTPHDLNNFILETIQQKKRSRDCYVNIHGLNLAYQYPWLRDYFNSLECVHCDGVGVALGANLLHNVRLHKITYAAYIWELASFAETHSLSMFLLGAQPGVTDQAAQALIQRHPRLKIVGTYHGYFAKDLHHPENQAVLEMINTTQPDILLIGFGMPIQEEWLMHNWDHLKTYVGLTIGAGFDYAAGSLRRPPRWMVALGLEWLGRLLIEPQRLWRRYLIGNPLFFWRVIKQKLGKHYS